MTSGRQSGQNKTILFAVPGGGCRSSGGRPGPIPGARLSIASGLQDNAGPGVFGNWKRVFRGRGEKMKKLFSFLDDSGIKYNSVTFGGAFLYSAPVSCPGAFVAFSLHPGGPDNAPEKEQIFRDYMRRRRALEILDARTVYAGPTSYRVYKVAPVREFAAVDAAARHEGRQHDTYFQILHDSGQAAADAWFRENSYNPAA